MEFGAWARLERLIGSGIGPAGGSELARKGGPGVARLVTTHQSEERLIINLVILSSPIIPAILFMYLYSYSYKILCSSPTLPSR